MPLKVPGKRNSFIQSHEIYFWTGTINKWKNLLVSDQFKDIIIDSWQYLSEKELIDIFGFVIMPNHFHSIMRINKMNGKESPQASFLKYTAHQFRNILAITAPAYLDEFAVHAHNKKHEFWQRDPLGIPLFTKEVALQKLNYIHFNPIVKKWNLANKPEEYRYSSAQFYKTGFSEFKFLKNLWTVLK
jgi:REP element-mobilizing transposase RayT